MLTMRTVLAGLVAAIVAVGLALFGALESSELGALDRLFEARGPRTPVTPIVLVSIDEDSFDELNLQWPFPRALHARLIDAVSAGHPLAIGFDLVFSEPSLRGPADDEAFGAAVARAGNVVLGTATTSVAERIDAGSLRLDVQRDDPNLPLPAIRRGAAAVGPVNVTVDGDGHLRRAILRQGVEGQAIESFDVAVYRLIASRGVRVAPLPPADRITVNFRGGPHTFSWVPYHRVLSGTVTPDTFRGAVVLVGATSGVLQDVYSTPFAPAREMPGVEFHAHTLDTLVRGDAIYEAPRWASLGATVIAAFAAAALAARLRVLRAFLAVAAVWILLAGAAFAAFAAGHVWFRAVGVTLALVLGYGITVVDNYIREQRERRRLSQFFSPAVLSEIVRHRGDSALGSSRRLITVLFSDIRGFTSISEKVEPEQVAEMLREYLTEMTDVVFRHGGTVDKYVGDCIMALYNAPFDDPDHAANAIRTGLELQERTLAVSARWEARLGAAIRNGVGINTGEAVVGAMGSRQRLEYTAIGDTVNLASRLESLTKEYGSGIVISESTHEAVKGRFIARQLGAVPVKGKMQPVKIYGVVPGDARKSPRVALDVAATVMAAGGGPSWVVRVRNVGEGGLLLLGLPAEVGAGTRIEVRCEGGGLAKPLAAQATVVWRAGQEAGAAFTGLDPDTAAALAARVAAPEGR
jgi:adenylate cyclase